jgi:hypothetical protein
MAHAKAGAGVDEFGDFQTPLPLAMEICGLLEARGERPAAIVEPTCGTGSFLLGACEQFPRFVRGLGFDISVDYVKQTRAAVISRGYADRVEIVCGSFFNVNWRRVFGELPEPLLVVGNPPWVTNAALGAAGSSNLPDKSNFQKHGGLNARTGKSNFDISEWMLIRLLEALDGRRATLAMLCKKAVARKVLLHAWKNAINLSGAEIRSIDARAHFGAAVEACFLTCSLLPTKAEQICRVYRGLSDREPASTIGYHDHELVADVAAHRRWKHLEGKERYKWRSGVKHDCAKVMELRQEGNRYRNGLGEIFELESAFVYPMLKSSEIKSGCSPEPTRWMLVTQQTVGEDTAIIRETARATWSYLERHAGLLDHRASSIYRGRPRFSIFGVGEYTFAPWKVAISGFYKQLDFSVVGSFAGKPIVLDDTCYSISFHNEAEARYVASLLNSAAAREFLSAYIFWDAKRPITIETLRRLDLWALAREHGSRDAPAYRACRK